MKTIIAICAAVAFVVCFSMAYIAISLREQPLTGGASNDTVLKESQYREFFKKEGNGGKNYLYTVTEFDNKNGEHCTVVTGASETSVAIHCTKKGPQ